MHLRLIAVALALAGIVGAVPTQEAKQTHDAQPTDKIHSTHKSPSEHKSQSTHNTQSTHNAQPTHKAKPTHDSDGHGNFSYIIDPWDHNPPSDQVAKTAAEGVKQALKGANGIFKVPGLGGLKERDESPPANVAGYQGLIPGCNDDPSYVIPKNTKYAVDSGVKVPKNGDNDECTTGHDSSHCWTEYYLVEQAIEYTNWREQGAGIDCARTSLCDSASVGLKQSCTAIGTDTTDGYDIKIIEGGLSIELDLGWFKASPSVSGGGTTVTHSKTISNVTNACVATSDTTTCHWDDKKCHQLWVADRVMHVWGYAQRVCIGGSDNTQQNTKNSRGYYIHGQNGFDFKTPINTLQGCGALCSDHTYGLKLPKAGARHPFPTPAGW